MQLTEFRQKLIEYEQKARVRKPERLNNRDDTPWNECVIQEMLMDVMEKLAEIRGMLGIEDNLPKHESHENVL